MKSFVCLSALIARSKDRDGKVYYHSKGKCTRK